MTHSGDSPHHLSHIPGLDHRILTAEEEVLLAKAIEAGAYAEFLLNHHPSESEVSVLSEIVKVGAEAKRRFIEANLRLVYAVARRYKARGVTFEDTIQDGVIGLIKAVEKYDYAKGFRFSTYAAWWIRQACTAGMSGLRVGHVPEDVESGLWKVGAAKSALEAELNREPTVEEIAENVKATPKQVRRWLRHAHIEVSLDNFTSDDVTFSNFFPDESAEEQMRAVEREYDNTLLANCFKEMMQFLDQQEQQVVALRFGFGVEQPLTLVETGKAMGISRERVRQIESKALRHLSKDGKERHLDKHL